MFETCQDHDFRPEHYFQTRRQFLQRFGMGFGALGLAGLLGPELIFSQSARAAGEISSLAPKTPPLPSRHANSTFSKAISRRGSARERMLCHNFAV